MNPEKFKKVIELNREITDYNNPVDAAFEMVVWLKENEYKEE